MQCHNPAVGAADSAVIATGVHAAAPPNIITAALKCPHQLGCTLSRELSAPRTSHSREISSDGRQIRS